MIHVFFVVGARADLLCEGVAHSIGSRVGRDQFEVVGWSYRRAILASRFDPYHFNCIHVTGTLGVMSLYVPEVFDRLHIS